ncbi:unnamed protein product [Gemmataceae bacterium]|nr:unnamed protein product [Gemmataceae bacterium]VTT99964.1 unnamed protein product [Gemmataceae bacterium]
MIPQVARGLVVLGGLRLFVEPVAGQQPAADPAQLGVARALREDGKFDEAGKLLRDAVGTSDKPGPAFRNAEFRKELARLYEARAATLMDQKAATAEWGNALREWTTLFQFAQSGLKPITPDTPPEKVKQLKSAFFDSYFEIQRVLVTANEALIKNPAKLAASFEKVGTNIFNVENIHKFNEVKQVPNAADKMVPIKVGTEVIAPEVWTRYCDLLDAHPELKAAYQKAGGRFFLERPPTSDPPPASGAGAAVPGACDTGFVAPAPQCPAHTSPRKVVRGAWPLCRKMATYR